MVLFYSDQQRAKGVKVKMYTLDLMGESLAQLTLYSQQKRNYYLPCSLLYVL